MRVFSTASLVLCLAAFGCERRSESAPVSTTADASTSVAAASTSRVAALPPLEVEAALAPRLTEVKGGLLLTWLEQSQADAGAAGHRFRVRKLGAAGWGPPSTIVEGTEIFANWADFPSVAEAADGALVAHWARKHGSGGSYAYDVALARSTDGGATWTQLGLAHDDNTATEHGFVSLLPDGAGVRAFWLDGRHSSGAHGEGHVGAMTLRTALIGADGKLSAGQQVDGRVCDCCQTSAAMTDGGPLIAFRDREKNEVRDIGVARRDGEKWTTTRVNPDGWRIPGCPVNGPKIVAQGKRVAVAWYTYAASRPSVRVAFSSDSGATYSAPVEIDGPNAGSAPVGRVDLLLDGEDAIVVWLTGKREATQIAARRVRADGKLGEVTTLAQTSPERQSGFPRIAKWNNALWLARTHAGKPSSVEVKSFPLATIAPATAASPAANATGPAEGSFPLGSAMPEFSATRVDGKAATLKALAPNAVLVNLWATWCEPCRQEMPVLSDVTKRFGKRGLKVVGISVDAEKSREEVAQFVAARKVAFDVWHDPDDKASAAFASPQLPSTYLFDRAGKLVWKRHGAIAEGDAEFEAAIQQALKK